MRLGPLEIGLVSLLSMSTLASTQQPVSQIEPQGPGLTITSHAVLVDVIVSDSSGKPITGLSKDAFTVTEQGKPQTISFFEENGVTAPVQQVELPKLPPNVFTNFSPFPQPPAVNVLLLDSLNTRMEDQSVVHSRAMKFLESAKPGTRTAIFTMGLALHFIQGFNDDPAVLATALNNKKNIEVETAVMLKSQAETNAQLRVVAMGADGLAHLFGEMDAASEDDRKLITLGNLQQLATFLQGFPGRKNIIWFCEKPPGVFNPGGSTGNPAIEDEIKKTIAMLGTARAAIYPVDARGTSNYALFTAENNPTTVPNPVLAERSEDMERNTDQLNAQILAEESGGQAFANMNGLSEIIDKVTSNSAHFYTLSYVPTNAKVDGVFRNISVKVAGGKYNLSYRRGYFAVDTNLTGIAAKAANREIKAPAAPSSGAIDPLLPFMDLGMPQSDQILYKIRIIPTPTGENAPRKNDRNQYKVDFAIELKDLDLDLGTDGVRRGTLNFSSIVYDRYGNVIGQEAHLAALSIKQESYAVFKSNGVQLHAEISVPTGNYWLRTGVYDQRSRKVGTLEIPLSAIPPIETAAKKQVLGEPGAKPSISPPLRSVPRSQSEAVSVEQLEQIIKQLHDKSDKEAAQRIADLKLGERLTTVRLDRLEESLPGERSRMALLAIADVAAFRETPSMDLDSGPPPDQNVQRQILSRAVDFVVATTAKMPDFLAEKKTLRFQDTKFATYENEPVVVTPDLYHLVDDRVVTVQYRAGREEETPVSNAREQRVSRDPIPGMVTHGIFGPMLETVMRDILRSKIGWSRWDKSRSRPVAVFRYAVPKDQATFTVTWCCAAHGPGPGIYQELQIIPKYHGEISVDPDSGAITRLVFVAELESGQPVSTANITIEYGPVEIAGKTYFCPTRSATLLVANSILEHGRMASGGETYLHATEEKLNVTSVSDTRFDKYHVFRSEMKVVE